MSNGFKQSFTRIKDLSDRRRMVRLGKIRLGVVVPHKTKKKADGTPVTYPRETEYFVCPPEVQKIYGQKPTEIDIMFPVNDRDIIFPQALKHYGKSKGLKCTGNGEKALYVTEDGNQKERECPCEKQEDQVDASGKITRRADCSQRAHLMVMLPKINLGGVYQIDIGSYNSIIDINSGIDHTILLMKEVLGVPRFAMIPLTLKRVPRVTHHDGKKQTHYTLVVHSNLTIDQLNEIKQDGRILNPPPIALPPVEDGNPVYDEGATVVDEEDVPAEDQTTEEASEDKTLDEQCDDIADRIRHYTTKKKLKAVEFRAMQEAAQEFSDPSKRLEYWKTQLFAVEEGSKE